MVLKDNYKFDWANWYSEIKKDSLLLSGNLDALMHNIVGPFDLFANEFARSMTADEMIDRGSKELLVDVFVWSLGEPQNRWATKSGGLPYRSSSIDWPRTKQGRPMGLLGQINFSNSTDLVGKLPGDLLLVFGDDRENGVFEFQVEWQTLIDQDVISEAPTDCFEVTPVFGSILRRTAFPSLTVDTLPIIEGETIYNWPALGMYPAWQIMQKSSCASVSNPLCRIGSFYPRYDLPFPWMNAGVIDSSRFDNSKLLTFGDMGHLDIYFDGNQVRIEEISE